MNQESVSITIPKHNSVADGRMYESSQLIAQHQMDVISFASLGKLFILTFDNFSTYTITRNLTYFLIAIFQSLILYLFFGCNYFWIIEGMINEINLNRYVRLRFIRCKATKCGFKSAARVNTRVSCHPMCKCKSSEWNVQGLWNGI